MKIIAIGGGEIGRPGYGIETKAIDKEIIKLTKKKHPKALLILTEIKDVKVPMHGTKMKKWKPIFSKINKRFKKYPGYISSHSSYRADDNKLKRLAREIREVKNGN